MMQVQPWELWWADVRFEDSDEIKRRPVLIAENGTAFILAYKVTSKPPRDNFYEYEIIKWKSAGLPRESTIRLSHKLELQESDIKEYIGKLQPADIVQIMKKLT